jgi:hypothetical protein
MAIPRLGFIAALLALASCGPAIPPAGNYATVSGRVTDASNGAGIANATVTVNVVLAATTDASGNFRIVNVPTGGWDYNVTAPTGFVSPGAVDYLAPLMPGESRTIAISLTHR